MVRALFVDSNGIRKGAWSPEEDNLLKAYIERFGHSNWRALPKRAGLSRCGKSCRLRWMNYLQPGVKRGNYSKQEQDLIIQMHNRYGNKWSKIAELLPGRTDNEIKNYWHTNLKNQKKQRSANNEVKEKHPTKKSNYIASPPPILESSSYSSNVSCVSGNLITEDSQTSFDQDHSQTSFDQDNSSEFDSFWSQPFVADHQEYNYQTFFPSYEDSFDLFYQIMQELPPI